MSVSGKTSADRYSKLAKDMVTQAFSPEAFSHQDHIGVAFELLKLNDFIDAAAIFSREIRRFASSQGAPEKYNTTITLAFLAIVAERMSAQTQDFNTFLSNNEDLLSTKILEHWYTAEHLNTEFARKAFLMPRKTQASPGSLPVYPGETASDCA
jgi:hypothetical protein